MRGTFPQKGKGFHRAEWGWRGGGLRVSNLMMQRKGLAREGLFASLQGLCYSNQVVDEQWSFPVARSKNCGPAPSEGKGKPVRRVS